MGVKTGLMGEMMQAAGGRYGGARLRAARLHFLALACGASAEAASRLLQRAEVRPAKVPAIDMLRDWASRFGVTIPED